MCLDLGGICSLCVLWYNDQWALTGVTAVLCRLVVGLIVLRRIRLHCNYCMLRC